MKIALFHDNLVQVDGAERVAALFHRMWPAAPSFPLDMLRKQALKFATGVLVRNIQRFLEVAGEEHRRAIPPRVTSSREHTTRRLVREPDFLKAIPVFSPEWMEAGHRGHDEPL